MFDGFTHVDKLVLLDVWDAARERGVPLRAGAQSPQAVGWTLTPAMTRACSGMPPERDRSTATVDGSVVLSLCPGKPSVTLLLP